jgi:hypothetical protein
MAMKVYSQTPKRTYRQIKVTGRELLVIDTPEVKVTISTGTIDVNNGKVLEVTVTRNQRYSFEVDRDNPPQEVKVRAREIKS